MCIPSPYEECAGTIWDPVGHSAEIERANQILEGFLSDMTANRAPVETLETIRNASNTLGEFAGYPADAAYFEEFFCSADGVSYRQIATLLPGFMEQMNRLIAVRSEQSKRRATASCPTWRKPEPNSSGGVKNMDDDVPF